MTTGTRRALIFAAAVALLVLAFSLVPGGQPEAEWKAYQRAYFEATGEQGDAALRQLNPTVKTDSKPELCTTCHFGLEEISASHPVDAFGCVVCHGGDGMALDEEQAHRNLIPNPSDLSVAEEVCGQEGCHGGYADPSRNHVEQVMRSIQATYAGGIALVRYTFGAQGGPEPVFGAVAAVDPNPLPGTLASLAAYRVDEKSLPPEINFARSCLESGCHLSEPAASLPYHYRAAGCAACHVLYGDDGLYKGADPTIPRDEPGHPAEHRFTTKISFTQCNHCHNRGNYSLRDMAFTPRPDLPPVGASLSPTMPPEGRRLVEYYQPIGVFTLCEWELDCIDCHTQAESMGDGHIWPDQASMQYVQCRTCHGTLAETPATAKITDPEDPAMRRARLNGGYPLRVGDVVVLTERGEKLESVQVIDGEFVQFRKVDGKRYVVPMVMGSGCPQEEDEQESRYCHECHAYER